MYARVLACRNGVLLRIICLQMCCLALRSADHVLLQKSWDNVRLVSVSRPLKGDVYGVTLSKWQFFYFGLIAIKAKASPLNSHVLGMVGLVCIMRCC